MAQHPLTLLRNSVGLSHRDYAQLVADTHHALGFGHIHARREKISRWESGRVIPALTAQLAMAHVHGVDEEDVLRRGWPHWLHLATDDAALVNQPWTAQGAIDSAEQLAGAQPRSYLAVTGPGLHAQLRAALLALADPKLLPAREGPPVPSEALTCIESRTQSLEAQEAGSHSTPMALLYATRTELQLITTLLNHSGYGSATRARLLGLAARTARLCSCLSTGLGEVAIAERYALTAIRMAVATGGRHQALICLADLAGIHLVAGDPRDALSVIHAARTAPRHLVPHLAATLRSWEALALARLGEPTGSAQAMNQAGRILATELEEDVTCDQSTRSINEMRLALCTGISWLHLDRPKQALPSFITLFGEDASVPSRVPPCPVTAAALLYMVDVQLSLGELDAAARSTHRAIALVGDLPTALAQQYHQRFAPYENEPLVKNLFAYLTPQPSSPW
ncbi:hypothetical protein [Streptomyces syringium]|uniref:hypothetical protein n=1 Tax=Streptomyces syringium TaxID=76729 RepID=UPI003437D35C